MANSVQKLQILCSSMKWPPPIYNEEMGPCQCQHAISCQVLQFKEIGIAKKKKLAKRAAAQKILEKLQNTQIKSINNKSLKDENLDFNSKNFNFVQFLHQVAKEQKFTVTYMEMEKHLISGKSQCLLQLSTSPIIICYGEGRTLIEGQMMAARDALKYLKCM